MYAQTASRLWSANAARFDPSSLQLPNRHIDSSIRQLSAAGGKSAGTWLYTLQLFMRYVHILSLNRDGGRGACRARRLLPQIRYVLCSALSPRCPGRVEADQRLDLRPTAATPFRAITTSNPGSTI
jgi:hypothetical protein